MDFLSPISIAVLQCSNLQFTVYSWFLFFPFYYFLLGINPPLLSCFYFSCFSIFPFSSSSSFSITYTFYPTWVFSILSLHTFWTPLGFSLLFVLHTTFTYFPDPTWVFTFASAIILWYYFLVASSSCTFCASLVVWPFVTLHHLCPSVVCNILGFASPFLLPLPIYLAPDIQSTLG